MYRECFSNLAEKNCIFYSILDVLEAVASSHNGIGEVVCDYAKQAHEQLMGIVAAGSKVMSATQSDEDLKTLQTSAYVMKTIDRFLELLPAAMRRNRANMIGRQKLSVRDIERMSYAFSHSSQVQLLAVINNEAA